MLNVHIGIVKFYDNKNHFGYIRYYNHNRKEVDRYFSREDLADKNFKPTQSSVIFFKLLNRALYIYEPTDKIQIPWDEIWGYANENFCIINDKSGNQSVDILNPFLENISINEIQNLIFSIVAEISNGRISEKNKKCILDRTKKVLFPKVLSSLSLSDNSRSILDYLKLLIKYDDKEDFLRAVQHYNDFNDELKREYILQLSRRNISAGDLLTDKYGISIANAIACDDYYKKHFNDINFPREKIKEIINEYKALGGSVVDQYNILHSFIPDESSRIAFLGQGGLNDGIKRYFYQKKVQEIREYVFSFDRGTLSSLPASENSRGILDDLKLLLKYGEMEDFLRAAKYYNDFNDELKREYILQLSERNINAGDLLKGQYGTSIANAIACDDYYKEHFNDIGFPQDKIKEIINEYKVFGGSVDDQYNILCSFIPDETSRITFLNQGGLNDGIKRYFYQKKVQEIWEYIINNTVVFDIEGDKYKGIGWEFAYKNVGNCQLQYVKPLEGQRLLGAKQWKELEDAITSSSIIVGHNIRRWDYPLLTKRNESFGKGSEYLKNTWDTLEIELLLNPLRPSFALNAENGHKANNDVIATEILLIQQLYAILESKESYELVKTYLPSVVVSQIDKRADIIFLNSRFSMHDAKQHNELFYKPAYQDIPELIQSISGNLLIVADEDSWQSVFNKFNAKFYSDSPLDVYNTLDLEKISENYSKPKNIYERALLAIAQNCKRNKKPLNIKAIPQIIRYEISDKVLRKYVLPEAEPNVICSKPEIVDVVDCDINFDNVLILCDSLIPRCSFIKNCNEQIIDIIEEPSEYSIYTQAFPVNIESLVKLGIKANPCREYWIAQPVPKEFVVLSRLSRQFIIDTLEKKYPKAKFLGKDNNSIVEDFANVNPSFEEDDSNCIFSLGKYWASRLEAFNKYETLNSKILIVDTYAQAESASNYLGIPYAHKDSIRNEFDKAAEKTGYNVITVLQDLLDCDAYDLGAPFCFFLNDKALLSKQSNGDIFEKATEQLKKRLSLFGDGSQVQFLDDYLLQPDAISEEQIANAEECFGKEDTTTLTKEDLTPLLDWIRNKYNITDFRGLQEPAIKKVIEYDGPNKNFLTILPTGGGKSVIFQGPILYKAIEKGSKKLSLVITPLQALMEDQVKDLIDKGFDSSLIACINGDTLSEERRRIIKNIRKHKVSLLYIAPERLMMRNFFQNIIRTAAEDQGIDSIIFDEAHCITAWGMDFRSDYILALRKCLELQKAHKCITIQMFTATLPWQSMEDLKDEFKYVGREKCNIQILPEIDLTEGSDYHKSLCPIRDHIELVVKKLDASKDGAFEAKMNAIRDCIDNRVKQNLLEAKSRMIVFTRSRDDAEKAAEWFKNNLSEEFRGRVAHFHAKIKPSGEKDKIIKNYKNGQILILCATKAFGLGMNIPNIHYVFHLAPPTFIEDYLQEVGRAARKKEEYESAFPDGETIKAVCLYTSNDLKGKIDRVECLSPQDISKSFDSILGDIRGFDNEQGTYVIPLKDEMFQQSINWLSKSNGLNRISVGFKCSDTYDLGINPEAISGLNENSQLRLLLKSLGFDKDSANKKIRAIIHINKIISDKNNHINSPEELEFVIEDGIQLGVFNRDYSYIYVSLQDKDYIKKFVSNQGKLLALEHISNLLIEKNQFEEFNIEDKLDKLNESKSIKETINQNWKFFLQLNILYPVNEIKDKLENLIRTIGSSQFESVSWKAISDSIHAENDPDKVKLFLFAAYKLGYVTRSESCTDYIEIKINKKESINSEKDRNALTEISKFYDNKQLRAGAMCGLIEDFTTSENAKDTIREYSKCPDEKLEKLPVIANNKKRLSERKSLESTVMYELNEEQRAIYELPANMNINVRAGAGSGKTRLLIYRALKLILVENAQVLILAYNTAVRDEIEKRLFEYSDKIGSNKKLKNAHIYTFHAFAAHCIPELTEKGNSQVPFKEWESRLLEDITKNKEKYKSGYQYILIDEFQDVTSTRLEIIENLLELNATEYLNSRAFVIGDMFQSIYGYEKKEDNIHRSSEDLLVIDSIEPIKYYEALNRSKLKYENRELKCNYRSYQTIINTAEAWFDNLIDWSDKENYKQQYIDSKLIPTLQSMILDDDFSSSSDRLDTITRDGEEIKIIKPYKIIKRDSEYDWKNDFESIWNEFLSNRLTWGANPQNNPCENHFCSIGILFRGNADVQAAYNWLIKQDYLTGKDIYVQGADVFYYSTREFYFFRKKLEEKGDCIASKDNIESLCKTMEDSKEYDDVILKVARDLALYIMKKGDISFLELSSKFDEIAKREQEKLREFLYRRQKDSRISICVSTIHKIKGLEFDCVIIPASTYPIGFNNENMSDGEKNMEERRLMYVAFSRAKYMLYYYEGDRERSIIDNTAYAGINGKCYANDGQSKVDIGLLVQNWLKDNNDYVRRSVKINDAITLKQHNEYCYGNGKPKWFIYHGEEDKIIGCLAQNNELLEKLYISNKTVVEGLHVKSVNIITKEESEKRSSENEGHDWSGIPEGGYVYYIDYYGCINLNTGNGKQN